MPKLPQSLIDALPQATEYLLYICRLSYNISFAKKSLNIPKNNWKSEIEGHIIQRQKEKWQKDKDWDTKHCTRIEQHEHHNNGI